MAECDNCGEHVSANFARMFRVEGVVGSCPNCVANERAGLPIDVIESNHGGAQIGDGL